MNEEKAAVQHETPLPSSGVVLSTNGFRKRREVAEMLQCPFEMQLNPSHEQAGAETADWAIRMFGMRPQILGMLKARPEIMAGGFYPSAPLARLRLATDYLLWAFNLDDTADESEVGAKPKRLAQLFQRYDEIFMGNRPKSGAPATDRALFDVLSRLSELADRAQMENFRHQNFAYFGAMLWEAANREAGWVPDVASYMALRPAAGAVPPFYGLIPTLEMIRPAAIGEVNPVSEKLSGRLACWINDVLSAEKEKQQGDLHNLVIVFERHYRLSEGEALRRAIEFCREEFSLLQVSQQINTLSDEARRYLGVLKSFAATTLEWTLTSARYTGD